MPPGNPCPLTSGIGARVKGGAGAVVGAGAEAVPEEPHNWEGLVRQSTEELVGEAIGDG